jgi:hypothetical protein
MFYRYVRLAAKGTSAGLRVRPCHRQESVTAGTVFHRTRTDLSKWFVAACLIGRDKRGVSAKAAETFIGGRGNPTSPGRSTANPDKSLVVAPTEQVRGLKCRRRRTRKANTDTL